METKIIGSKTVCIEPYDCMPCELGLFTINSENAYTCDFGSGEDTDWGDAPEYGCGCYEFTRTSDTEEIDKVKEKYKLTDDEFVGICNLLEEVLYVAGCGWCV